MKQILLQLMITNKENYTSIHHYLKQYKAFIYSSFIFTITLTIQSCSGISKDYDSNLYYGGDKLIIHAYLSDCQDVSVILKKTLPPDKINGIDSVKNVSIAIFDDNGHVADFVRQSRYLFTAPGLRLDPAKQYKLTATADNLNAQTQSQYLPTHLSIDTMYIHKFYDRYNDNYYDIFEVVLTNPHHYPHIYIDRKDFPLTPDITTIPDIPWEESQQNQTLYDYKFLPNLYIRLPQQKSATYHYRDRQIFRIPVNADSIQIILYTLSESTGMFLESITHYDGSVNDFNYKRPYPVFNNIVGGYGIFGTYTQKIYTYYPNNLSLQKISETLPTQR